MSLGLLMTAALGSMTVLTLNRMIRPRFTKRRLTSARFFLMQPRSEVRRRWEWSWPSVYDASYLMNMAAMGCLLAAAWFHSLTIEVPDAVRVHVCFDVSCSMGTRQSGTTRSQLAFAQFQKTLRAIRSTSAHLFELRVSTFDLDADEVLPVTTDLARGDALGVGDFHPRSLGTDLMALRRWLGRGPEDKPDWTPTHVIVITDQPKPQWAAEDFDRSVQWIDIASKVANQGFAEIVQQRDLLTGRVDALNVKLRAYGPLPDRSFMKVLNGSGVTLMEKDIAWDENGVAAIELLQPTGVYRIELGGEDAWAEDNLLCLEIPDVSQVQVDWRVVRQKPPAGWKIRPDQPRLVVADYPVRNPVPMGVPLLVIGTESAPITPSHCFLFPTRQGSPLLETVNLDALEAHRDVTWITQDRLTKCCGQVGRIPSECQSVLQVRKLNDDKFDDDSRDKLALAKLPATDSWGPVVWIPVLPDLYQLAKSPEELAWQAVFYNAVAWLIADQEPLLYALTSRANPERKIDNPPFRLALHPEEGDTSHGNGRPAEIDLRQRAATFEAFPAWQFPVLIALVLLVTERFMAILRKHDQRASKTGGIQ